MLTYRRSRVLLLAIIVIAFVLLISNSFRSSHITVSKTEVISSTVFKASEFMSLVTGRDDCPVCFGEDMCEELSRLDYEISRDIYSPDRAIPGIYQVYEGQRLIFWLKPLASWPLIEHSMKGFENFVCRNATETIGYKESSHDNKDTCHLATAAMSSFLVTTDFNELTLRQLHSAHLISRRRMPLSVCPTWTLIDGLVRAFDLDNDNALMGREKATMLTTLAGWPDTAVNRFINSNNVRIPRLGYYGACGKVSVVESDFRPLLSFIDKSLDVRKNLALQLFKLVDAMLNEDARWILYTSDITLNNLVVTTAEEVAFLDMSQIMILDRSLIEDEVEEEEETGIKRNKTTCDYNCHAEFYDNLMDSKDTKPCFKIRDHLDYMVALVCRNVLSDMESERSERQNDLRGLLHGFGSDDEEAMEVNNLLRECIDEKEEGGRMVAKMNLEELLQTKFESDEYNVIQDENNQTGPDLKDKEQDEKKNARVGYLDNDFDSEQEDTPDKGPVKEIKEHGGKGIKSEKETR